MADRNAILFANEAFYAAFAERDVAAMDELWSRDAPVACIHPGWPALTDRLQVMQSWVRILASDRAPKVACRGPQAFVYGDVAFVICYEEVDGSALVATNIFRREGQRWRIVHHQAGPTPAISGEEEEEEPDSPARPN